jgi:transglutaminase-like putative cysteine protease
VLDDYSNGTFKLSPVVRGQFQPERTNSFQAGHARPRLGGKAAWTFYLEPGVSRYLPVLGPFEMLRFRESQNYRYAPAPALLALREEPASMTAYRVEGFAQEPILPDPDFAARWRRRAELETRPSILQRRLSVSDGDREILRRAVTEINGDGSWPAGEFARRAGEWLRRQHNYSLAPSIPRGDNDPLVRWMMSREAGHCELFAGSFVLLARAAGFPARVVTGFRGGSWNGFSNNFTIRNSEAHAWAEIFDETAGGWLRTDPLAPVAAAATEEVRGEAAVASRLDRSWKARLDSLRVFWYRRIVSFDQQSQAETLKAVKEATQNTGKRLRAMLEDTVTEWKGWLTAPWDGRKAARVLGVLAALGLVGWWWREYGRAWWRARPRGRGARRDDPLRQEASRWLARLTAYRKTGDESTGIVAELQRVRFGARETWPDPAGVFARARRELRAARRRARVSGS